MQPAFFLLILFPPPTARALGLTDAEGARAWRTADGRKATIVQRIVWNAIVRDVARNIARGPIRERVDLDQRVLIV